MSNEGGCMTPVPRRDGKHRVGILLYMRFDQPPQPAPSDLRVAQTHFRKSFPRCSDEKNPYRRAPRNHRWIGSPRHVFSKDCPRTPTRFSRQVTRFRSRLRTYKKGSKISDKAWCRYGDANSPQPQASIQWQLATSKVDVWTHPSRQWCSLI